MFLLQFIVSLFSNLIPLMGSISNQAFPNPLSAEEEEHYLTLMANGDKNAREKLIEHNLRLVAHIVKKYQNQTDDKEDLISIGTIGLIKAIDSFSPDKGTKLATYAARCIDNEILMLFRSTKKMRNDVSLYDPIGYDKEGNEICLIDVVKDENKDLNDIIIQQLAFEKIEKNLKSLTQRERDIIVRRFGLENHEEETQQEIAKSYGISRSYVSRIEKRALMKLYREFIKN
ncbi:RNA polymerase sporulation sigma factor SigK [Turicibacter sanguinis]|uniref:RNA polymerase sigma factor n=2 Tax=Turicibacter sanguinis TaxID=154288 RepID=A0A9X5APX7_9FIRM|nr:RNA polymerase sporulation sigma factor SigK [Turicibacter sanguinis]EFF65082.1 RNA polymerase sigma-K factor [Turicibacter sanguinis PC909]MCU7191580.1 RNA polymerase sporulation sigma factor SigK [Turicibacter sanguinis]MCU7196656.1 RNA polymerase sporulation sigma factor SigK [Turicibacter sanguinis]MCU7201935.1 RNA polymerase sporulation sigma factor SigK [Turicibacter sanguinis]MCU7212864.1 RNA polymerase sporulation sigma factor SigK [Turicibacter sanguinis]